MLLHDRPSCRTLSVLLLIHIITPTTESSGAAPELMSSPQPITALVGDDVILPCHLEPAVSASDETVVWTKPGLDPKYIHVHRNRKPVNLNQNRSYINRTDLFVDQLTEGNVSMKLLRVKMSDAGEYFCILESMQKGASVRLIVAAASTPVLNIAEIDPNKGGVVLQCNSTGWYPEPEVFWLDGEGNLLSAGPPETVRGPDDLYTVSSRVTVEKRHSNSFTCRVTQKETNQTRETTIQVPADFFRVQASRHWIWVIFIPPVGGVLIGGVLICIMKRKKRLRQHQQDEETAHKAHLLLLTKQKQLEDQGDQLKSVDVL